jgi:acetate kinase
MAAVKNGKSVDTSMGLGALDGLIMGTRSGQLDPTVIFYLIDALGYSPDKVRGMLNKDSGLKGLSGSSDMRDVEAAVGQNDPHAILAVEMYAYRIKKFIGAYAAAMNGLDALVFTAGVGENDAAIRQMVCQDLDFLGIYPDPEKNRLPSTEAREINTPGSPVKIFVIPTNEELKIAADTLRVISATG